MSGELLRTTTVFHIPFESFLAQLPAPPRQGSPYYQKKWMPTFPLTGDIQLTSLDWSCRRPAMKINSYRIQKKIQFRSLEK